MKRQRFLVAVLVGCLAGCTALKEAGDTIADAVVGDPLGSALITTSEQVHAVRSVFIARDVAAINACEQAGATLPACVAERCIEPACVLWRTKIDPAVTEAYNLAYTAWNAEQAESDTRTLVIALLVTASQGFERLAVLEPGSDAATVYQVAARAVQGALTGIMRAK